MILKAMRWSAMLLLTLSGVSLQAEQRLAHGLIVKLKEASAPSVVQMAATVRPKDSAATIRARLALVAQRHGVPYANQRATAFGAQVLQSSRPVRFEAAEAQARRLRADPDVEWVVVNEIARPQAELTTSDARLADQTWILDRNTGPYANIPAAFERLQQIATTRGQALSPVVVAVLDSGVVRHPDLVNPSDRVLFNAGYDFVAEAEFDNDAQPGRDADASDPGDFLTSNMFNASPVVYEGCDVGASSWHGTMTSGILAAAMDNNRGIVGLLGPMPGAVVLPVRVAGNCGAAVSDIVDGMLWAAGVNFNGSPFPNPNPAKVISLSFGGDPGCQCDSRTSPTSAACLYLDAIQSIRARGAVLVAAAGNAGGLQAARPASCSGAIAVGALALSGAKASYSNLVPTTGLMAWGGEGPEVAGDQGVFTLSNAGTQGPVSGDETYLYAAGTSFTTPMVAGALALMWAVNPDLDPDEITWGLLNHGVRDHVSVAGLSACSGSRTDTCRCTTSSCGAGVLDVDRAVAWAASPNFDGYTPPPQPTDTTSDGEGGGGAMSPMTIGLGAVALMLAVAGRHRRRNLRPYVVR